MKCEKENESENKLEINFNQVRTMRLKNCVLSKWKKINESEMENVNGKKWKWK